jgi:hypothetical protein
MAPEEQDRGDKRHDDGDGTGRRQVGQLDAQSTGDGSARLAEQGVEREVHGKVGDDPDHGRGRW